MSSRSSKTFLAVIGDIVKSREIIDRAPVQRGLEDTLSAISRGNKSVMSAWTVTLGDEFQALYASPEGLMQDIWEVQALLFPYQARFAIGLGEIVTDIDPLSTHKVDGPAFHEARAGIEALKVQGEGLFAVRQGGSPRESAEDILNLAALVIYGGRGRARLDLAVELLKGRAPVEIGGEDASEVRRIQKLRKESGMELVVGALQRAEAACGL